MAIRDAFICVFNEYHSITTMYEPDITHNVDDQKPCRPVIPKPPDRVKALEKKLSTITSLYSTSRNEASSLKQEVSSLRDENVKLSYELEAVKSNMVTRDQSFQSLLGSFANRYDTTLALIRKDIEIMEAEHAAKALEAERALTQLVSNAMECIYKDVLTAKQDRKDTITPERVKEMIRREVGSYFKDSLSCLEEGTLHELFREKAKRSRGKKKKGKEPSESNPSDDGLGGSKPAQD